MPDTVDQEFAGQHQAAEEAVEDLSDIVDDKWSSLTADRKIGLFVPESPTLAHQLDCRYFAILCTMRPEPTPARKRSSEMLRLLSVTFLLILLSACTAVSHKVTMASSSGTDTSFVEDRTPPDSYPSLGLAQGNIYSCRYGIRILRPNDFDPPKAKMFANLISLASPQITSHKVTLQRFDVYVNHRLKSLNGAGNIIGGAIGAMISDAGRVNENMYTFQKLLVDADPYTARNPNEHQVGCDDAHEGEFYASEISGGHTVVVVWLKFSIDERAYNFRTFYQYQSANNSEEDAGVSAAMQMTFPAVGEWIARH